MGGRPTLAFMAKGLTWRDVAEQISTMPRGARTRAAAALSMDYAYLSRKLKTDDDLTTGQALRWDEFAAGDGGVQPPEAPRSRLPFFGYAAASEGDRVSLNPGQIIDWVELPFALPPGGEYFGVVVAGDSMEPRLYSGERIVVRRNSTPVRDRDVVIEFGDGSGVVKTYRGQRNGRVYAHQLNEDKLLDWDAATVKAIHNVFMRL